MASVTQSTDTKNDSGERGIYLTQFDRRVHACKVREDIGCGMTRCGITFLIGHAMYHAEAEFGGPFKEGNGKDWIACPKCSSTESYEGRSEVWRRWKYTVRRTLKLIGAIKD